MAMNEANSHSSPDAFESPIHELFPTEQQKDGGSQPPDSYVDTSVIFRHLANSEELRYLQQDAGCSISPERPERSAWDVFMLMLVIYSCIQTPYKIAFNPQSEMDWIDWTIDLCFYADIVLNFFTGYDKGFEVVMDRREIRSHYLRGWFCVDFVATVEWDSLWELIWGSDGNSLIKLARLIKILRMLRASRLIMRITSNWTIHTTYIRVSVFVLYVAMICHLLACFFFLLPDIIECAQDELAMPLEIPPEDISELEEWWRVGEADGPSADDVAQLASGIGWHKQGGCLQGSWRQKYGLEEICEIMDDAGVYRTEPWNEDQLNTLKDCYVTLATTTSHKLKLADGTMLRVSEVCRPCMAPIRMHIDAFYWALTTMTTIGYGDRIPSTQAEIVFVLFSEVFGLCIFCLLLQQINYLGEAFAEKIQSNNAVKNGVVGFLKDELGSDSDLIMNCVRFLNFRAASLSGHSFSGHDSNFNTLSPGLIREIQIAVYRPVVQRVRAFGWNKEDETEEAALQALFDRIDITHDGAIEMAEARTIFEGMEIELTQEQLTQVFQEMDRNAGGDVTFEEFKDWWFITKTGKPRAKRCPRTFLDELCTHIHTRPYAIDELVVHPGHYSKALVVVLAGSVESNREANTSGMSPLEPDTIAFSDREPAFGFATLLDHASWLHMSEVTSTWTVKARSYVDTAWVHRSAVLTCFEAVWPEGPQLLTKMIWDHYGVEQPAFVDASVTALDAEKAKLREAQLHANAPPWAVLMQYQLMQRMECIEKHMDETVSSLADLLREKQGGSKQHVSSNDEGDQL